MRIKHILITLLSVSVGFSALQDIIKVKATFDEYDEGIYSFTDEDERSYLFQRIDSVASKKYDLTDIKYVDKKFKVSYRMETESDENDETYEIYAIMDLKLIEKNKFHHYTK
ncbi:hypothetical protein MWU59_02710 [Flavobacteriaceae bacterium F08102]|nr:hypothetical protein [Flavobacteriaceae bacterium F08102]